MTTTRDIVTAALRRIRITPIATGQAPSQEEARYVLDQLNGMMHAWQTQGVDIKHVDLTLSDRFWFVVPPLGADGQTIAAMTAKGGWDASLNVPALSGATGVRGDYYRVTVAGSTTLDAISSWAVDDVAMFDGLEWRKGQSSLKHEQAVIDLLAASIANDFGKTVTREMTSASYMAWNAIAADFIVPTTSFDSGLRIRPRAAIL